jgi:predicted HTH domain antitoxin
MFLNDLEEVLLTKYIVGLRSITAELETEIEIYLNIFVMLYADDTILLAESAEDLQVQLNAFG